ncbi:DUF4138 domain-containing protein [Gelidibacter sp. F63206]|uniref:DUF4138 domain-containing protein n=1 Tax=Gelidibacter sp. F63206 TaxID=2926425 RepID=UPI001FF12C19|nr:DUF4138 domain-containing protein [Gelidibacter sp. F63206]MCK0114894.1 conjugative transposon protein TraN [Gelidibacter sp. F63206]
MKTHSLIPIIFMACSSVSLYCTAQAKDQNITVMDTIYANDTMNVALFFPEPIRQGITGSENFVFTYNRENEQYFGLLQATPGKDSNLLVINRNGSVFSYIVRYKSELSKLNYFIPMSSSIGNEKPVTKDSIPATSQEINKENKEYYRQELSSHLLERKPRRGKTKKRRQNIVLGVEDIVYNRNELYFVIKIDNKSTLDYDLNFLTLSIETRHKGKRKSVQRLHKEAVFTKNLPSKIVKGESARLVYVLPKFSLSSDRRAILELNEKDGERNIELKISHRYLNNPN